MQKKNLSESILTWVCVGALVSILGYIGLSFITQNILVERLHMDNAFTSLILGKEDGGEDNTDSEINSGKVKIDQEALSSRQNKDAAPVSPTRGGTKLIDAYRKIIQKVEERISYYATEGIPGYQDITEAANKYEDVIGWNIVPYSEYNGVQILEDGYLAELTAQKDITDSADATIAFAEFCREQGADFLYVAYPSKISKYEDTDISGVIDFSNQNADALLSRLDEAGVSYLDIRESIHEAGLSHRDLFYNTDHHWKAETGLWASGLILQELHDRFGMDTHIEVLDADNFTKVVYPDFFLGSQGRKITLARSKPEDITFLYPKSETAFHYEIPNIDLDAMGDFSVTYDMTCTQNNSTFSKEVYDAYNYGVKPLKKIENILVPDNGKVLFIYTSFSNCVIPFLAMDIKSIDALDLRCYTGSVETYIEQTHPDVVIVASNCGTEGPVADWTSHTSLWDFS